VPELESIRDIARRLLADINRKRIERGQTKLVREVPPAVQPIYAKQEWPFALDEFDKEFLRKQRIRYL